MNQSTEINALDVRQNMFLKAFEILTFAELSSRNVFSDFYIIDWRCLKRLFKQLLISVCK